MDSRSMTGTTPISGPEVEPLASIAGRVRELVEEEQAGFWRECSGCYETNDGYPVGNYPYSPALRCHLGGGCTECGGLGAVWDGTDWSDFADWSQRRDRTRETVIEVMKERLCVVNGEVLNIHSAADDIMSLSDAASAAELERHRLLGEERGRIAERERAAGIADEFAEIARVGAITGQCDPLESQLLDAAYSGLATTIRKDTSHE